jgi:hypothetical protein
VRRRWGSSTDEWHGLAERAQLRGDGAAGGGRGRGLRVGPCVSERKREGVETAGSVGPPSGPIQSVRLGFRFFSFILISKKI